MCVCVCVYTTTILILCLGQVRPDDARHVVRLWLSLEESAILASFVVVLQLFSTFPETKKRSPNTGARANNTLHQ